MDWEPEDEICSLSVWYDDLIIFKGREFDVDEIC